MNLNTNPKISSTFFAARVPNLHLVYHHNQDDEEENSSVVNFHDSFHVLKLEPPITAVYLMAAKESADSSYCLYGHTVTFHQ